MWVDHTYQAVSRNDWGWWNCVLLEDILEDMLSVLCSSHFVLSLQVGGECTAPSTEEADAGERRVWLPSVHPQTVWMCVQNTAFQHIPSRPRAVQGPSLPWSTPQHNHLMVGSSLLLLTILSDFSHFFIWAQSPSFHSRHPPGNLLPFHCQFSSRALPPSPPSTSHFSSQTPCWVNCKHWACLGLL